jgi:hypothetical protein
MTDAPDTITADSSTADSSTADSITPDTTDRIQSFVTAWRADLSGQTSVSATEVQDRLLDLWAEVPDGDRKGRVESWLTETLSRHLYSVGDLESRLSDLAAAGA